MTSWIMTLPSLLAQAATEPAVADAITQPASGATVGDGLSGLMKLAIAIAVIVGSFGLGSLMAKWLRLPEFAGKLGVICFAIIASSVICYFGWPPKLGIDLSGGVVLVYEVEGSALQSGKLQDLADTVAGRLNDGRNEKIVAKVVDGNIELRLPKEADANTVESQIAAMRGSGVSLNAPSKREEAGETILVFTPDETFQAVDMDKLVAAVNKRINPSGVKEVTVRQYGAESLEIIIPEIEQSEVDQIKNIISTSGALEFRILANSQKPEHKSIIERAMASPARELVEQTPEGRRIVAKWVNVTKDIGGEGAIMREAPDGKGAQALVVTDPFNVTGQYLRRAAPDIDQSGRDCITFSFNSDGAQLFGALTGQNTPDPATGMTQRLGIVLDNDLISAPTLQSQIRDQGQITGGFDKGYVEMVVSVLNAGSLPTALHKIPIQDQRISAQLGADTIRQGSRAMLIASGLVVLFMLFYYRFAGMVADIAVILNLLMVVAAMIMIKAAFTLPGLAGLVLTVGMAVDANVLIYERMREEQQRGASLRMAIRNGYMKAMSTIIDSNVTTIATGVVLYAIGSDQIKGFAVTLILGLMISMFTAVFVSRVIFDISEKKRWITRLNMLQWFKQTSYDFVGYMKPAAILSILVIGAGLVGVIARGKDLLDIDFTGGSSVQAQFRTDKPQTVAAVRAAVQELPDVTVSAIGTQDLEYKIDTSEGDVDVVRDVLKKSFGDALRTYSMSFGELKPFEAPAEKEVAPAEKPAEAPPAEEKQAEVPSEPESPKTPAAEEGKEPAAAEPAPAESPKSEENAPEAPKAEESKSEATAPEASQPETTEPAAEGEKKSAATRRSGSLRPQELMAASLLLGQQDETKTEDATKAEEENQEAGEAKTETDAKPVAAAPAETTAATSDVGTTTELSFPEKINYATLRERINLLLAEQKLEGTYFELTNKEYTSGSSLRYENWTLNIMLPIGPTRDLLTVMKDQLADEPVFPAANKIGGKVAGKTQMQAVYAILASLLMIVLYVWIRFQNVMFGFAAVLALLHDVLVAVSFLALSYWMSNNLGMSALLVDPFKISLAVVAALLTIVGFSINDTIVIFDRIREIRGKSPDLTGKMINQAVNETLSRTFITSGTVLIATLILYVFGGAGIHPFAFAMLIGVISGTYSTVYIAAPILLWMKPAGDTVGSLSSNKKEPVGSTR